MPIARKYKAGAVIFFEGDKSDEVFILKSGSVTLTYRGIETQDKVNEKIRVGEFFGVKSAIGRYKREETAHVEADSTVLVLSVREFDDLALRNIKIVLKMLKIFSTQLRKIGKQAAVLLSSTDENVDSATALFQTGDFFLKNKRFGQASYCFHKYIENNPNGNLIADARERISMSEKGISTGFSAASSSAADSGLSEEEDALLQEDGDEESFELSVDQSSLYDEGMDLISEGNYEDAIEKLKQIDKIDQSLHEKANYEIGKCYFEKEEYKNCVASFTNFIKEHPKTQFMTDVLFYVGKSYHKLEDIAKAKNFLQKTISMSKENEPIYKEAQAILNEIND